VDTVAKRIVAEAEGNAWARVYAICTEAASRIIYRTPVGVVDSRGRYVTRGHGWTSLARLPKGLKRSGRARGNWVVTEGRPTTKYDWERKDPGGQNTLAMAQQAILNMRLGVKLFISNALPYIVALEYGHSRTQAPHGMVRVTAKEMRGIIAKVRHSMKTGVGVSIVGARTGKPVVTAEV